jgi:hypothetical protein
MSDRSVICELTSNEHSKYIKLLWLLALPANIRLGSTYVSFRVKLDEILLPLEAQFPDLGPGGDVVKLFSIVNDPPDKISYSIFIQSMCHKAERTLLLSMNNGVGGNQPI